MATVSVGSKSLTILLSIIEAVSVKSWELIAQIFTVLTFAVYAPFLAGTTLTLVVVLIFEVFMEWAKPKGGKGYFKLLFGIALATMFVWRIWVVAGWSLTSQGDSLTGASGSSYDLPLLLWVFVFMIIVTVLAVLPHFISVLRTWTPKLNLILIIVCTLFDVFMYDWTLDPYVIAGWHHFSAVGVSLALWFVGLYVIKSLPGQSPPPEAK